VRILIPLVFITLSAATRAETHNMEEPININGQYQKRATPAERLKLQRKMLEARNEALVRKQIETLRLRQEIELMKKMKKAFAQNLENLENM
jgi:ABC-type phosphate transport system auxiliary subunit